MRKCVGFDKHEGKCDNQTENNPYWCPRCNKIRMEHITKQMNDIAIKMGVNTYENIEVQIGIEVVE